MDNYVAPVDNYVAPVDNYVEDGYNEAAFEDGSGYSNYVAAEDDDDASSYVDNYVQDGYNEAAFEDGSGFVNNWVAPPPEETKSEWETFHDEAMQAMYGGACSTCENVGDTREDGTKVTANDVVTAFYSQPDPFGKSNDKDDQVMALQPTSCRSRSRARRSAVRRQLRQKAKVCLQANVSTLHDVVEQVRFYPNFYPRGDGGGSPSRPPAQSPALAGGAPPPLHPPVGAVQDNIPVRIALKHSQTHQLA